MADRRQLPGLCTQLPGLRRRRVGDLAGVRARLPYLRSLGVDGIWLNPFYPSPQHDHGYDVSDYFAVHPEYGELESFDRLVHDAHRLDLKVLIDIVSNHCSTEHPWLAAALAAGPGSPERERFHFAEGHGENGELPSSNWRSIFGGSAWQRVTEPDGSPGQWYLHSFAPEQADFNWRHPDVGAYFEQVLRFWFERGMDGVRIDVAHGLHKADGLPDHENAIDDELTGDPLNPYAWNQPEVHQMWRHWRSIAEGYTALTGRERVLIGEVGALDTEQLALYSARTNCTRASTSSSARSLGRPDPVRRSGSRPEHNHSRRLVGRLGTEQP